VLISLCIIGVASGRASAHTSLDFTLPTDGASVGEVLSEVTVAFTEPVTMVGNGFEVLDPQGNVLEPFAVTDDDMLFRLQFDPPLAGGTVAVRYEVTSEDGHVVSGGFQFTISVDLPTTVPTTPPPLPTVPESTPAVVVATAPTAPPTAAPAPVTDATAPSTSIAASGGDDSSNSGTYIAIAAAIAVAAAAFLVIRSRTSG
jgi:methionine-rich copper-binding protein CopC